MACVIRATSKSIKDLNLKKPNQLMYNNNVYK